MPTKGQHCGECWGHSWGPLMMVPEGSGVLPVALWGEALGPHEEQDQLPFRPQAPAGAILSRVLRMAGINRFQLTLTNCIWCRPPANKLDGESYEHDVVSRCSYYNDRLMRARKPRCHVAMGGVPLRHLTSYTGNTKEKQSVDYLRGWAIPSRQYAADGHAIAWGEQTQSAWVIPTTDPSYIQRGAKELIGVAVHDLRLAVYVALRGVGTLLPVTYQDSPSLDEALAFEHRVIDSPQLTLSWDIETPWAAKGGEDDDADDSDDHTILSIQFSLGIGHGIQMPWTGAYIDIARRILASPNNKVTANGWQYDEPRIKAHGLAVRGRHDDLRWMWHALYPDLPANLQYIASFLSTSMRVVDDPQHKLIGAKDVIPEYLAEQPWKHTAQQYRSGYECKDVDFPQRILPLLVAEHKARGTWRAYEDHIRRIRPINDRACLRGIAVDMDRHTAFAAELDGALKVVDARCQELWPDELRKWEPAAGYKSDAVALKRQALPNQGLDDDDLEWATQQFIETGLMPIQVTRWVRIKRFLPDSPDQVLAYIRFKKHKVPKSQDDKDTTGKTGLEGLARTTKDPIYRAILEYRALTEMRGTHVEGWKPTGTISPGSSSNLERDNEEELVGCNEEGKIELLHGNVDRASMGRVHARITYTPATGQFACYGKPNILNPPKPKGQADKDRLAVSFRKMIVASPGRRKWEFDLRSAHALTLGYEAQDADYMRLARLDIHSYLTAHLEGQKDAGLRSTVEQCLGWPDDSLSTFLADIKKRYKSTRDDRAKPSILGYGFGMGYRKLYWLNIESFTGEAEAKKVHEMLGRLFPRAAKWRDEVRARAHKDGYLLSKSGSIRWFWDVYHNDPQGGPPKSGEDSEAAIAFLPANDAFCYMKDVMLKLDGDDEWMDQVGFEIPFHDALVFDMPIAMEDEAVPRIYQELTLPSPVLRDQIVAPQGLWIGASVSCGPDWGSMVDVDMGQCMTAVAVGV